MMSHGFFVDFPWTFDVFSRMFDDFCWVSMIFNDFRPFQEGAAVYGDQKQQYLADLSATLKNVPDAIRHTYLNDKLEALFSIFRRLFCRLLVVLAPIAPACRWAFESLFLCLLGLVYEVVGPRHTAEFASWHVEPYTEEMQMVGEMGPARVVRGIHPRLKSPF